MACGRRWLQGSLGDLIWGTRGAFAVMTAASLEKAIQRQTSKSFENRLIEVRDLDVCLRTPCLLFGSAQDGVFRSLRHTEFQNRLSRDFDFFSGCGITSEPCFSL